MTSGQTVQGISNIDAGITFQNSSIGDFVWEDANANGIQDAGENGIAGVEMTLSGTSGNGQAVSMNVVTDNNGYYAFNNVLPAPIKYPFKYRKDMYSPFQMPEMTM